MFLSLSLRAKLQDMELARALFTYCVTRLTALQSDMQFPMNADEELHRINQYVSFEEFQQAFERLADCINRASAPTGQHKPFIQTTLDYVRENLDNPNLSLKWISENILFMNVTTSASSSAARQAAGFPLS